MPRAGRGPYLWLRRARPDQGYSARWLIRDGKHQISTGFGEGDRREAEKRLSQYVAAKYQPIRRERPLSQILIADVIRIYLDDVVPGQARPEKAAERALRLVEFFGTRTLDEITAQLCRAYVASRYGSGRSNKGTTGGAKRDLEDLRAAINHHAREGYHRGMVRVVLPQKGKGRQRWLTRGEFARLLRVCWRTRETQEGAPTTKRPLRHLCRFLLLALYTGSRPSVVLTAAWERAHRNSHVDLAMGLFHRHAEGTIETEKRQPTVKLSPRLAAHLARWRRLDGGAGYVVQFAGAPVLSVKTALARAVKLAGLGAGVSAYTLRHSCASWLVAKGLPTRLIADFLGTSEPMILKHYGHLAPDYQERAAKEIGRK